MRRIAFESVLFSALASGVAFILFSVKQVFFTRAVCGLNKIVDCLFGRTFFLVEFCRCGVDVGRCSYLSVVSSPSCANFLFCARKKQGNKLAIASVN